MSPAMGGCKSTRKDFPAAYTNQIQPRLTSLRARLPARAICSQRIGLARQTILRHKTTVPVKWCSLSGTHLGPRERCGSIAEAEEIHEFASMSPAMGGCASKCGVVPRRPRSRMWGGRPAFFWSSSTLRRSACVIAFPSRTTRPYDSSEQLAYHKQENWQKS